ncbi:MAG: enoyl-CoA hydratase/isomerase family protein [Myxococcales bacterium]|nr:enoyl-CoA hydratase/isomerase family protein [Myxococcales bacterium]
MTDAPLVLRDRQDGVETWTLNRPRKLNSLDQAMVDALHGALDAVWDDQALRCVIVTGAGDRAFVAGADIAQLRERRHADALLAINATLFDRLARLPVPTIAAVNGFALGGGCELAMACDLRIAADNAKFGQPEVGLGIMAAAGGTYRLPALVGLGMARELLFTGRIIDAETAHAIGLVNRVVPAAELADTAMKLAQEIARADSMAVRMSKAALAQHTDGGPDLMAFESTAQAVLFESPEKFRRMDAFLARKARRAAEKAEKELS